MIFNNIVFGLMSFDTTHHYYDPKVKQSVYITLRKWSKIQMNAYKRRTRLISVTSMNSPKFK